MTREIYSIIIAVAFCFLVATVTRGAELPGSTPTLTLYSYGSESINLSKSDPLLLSVTISNPVAEAVRIENHFAGCLEEEYKAAGFKPPESKLQAPLQPVPRFTLGSKTCPIQSLLSFEVVDGNNSSQRLPVKSLKVNSQQKTPVRFAGNSALMLFFGIEKSEVAKLRDGQYVIQAVLNTNGNPRMWNGTVKSNSIKVNFQSPSDYQHTISRDSMLRLNRSGRYYLLDGDYEKSEECARKILKLNPDSIAGLRLLGDSLAGMKKYKDAESTFERAIAKYDQFVKKKIVAEKAGSTDRAESHWEPEAPVTLLRRLYSIRELKSN